ncbi:MAG TPA: hypothetical protein VJK49_04750, partial [Candidatus Limnocylindrales bacterium]|nr:hypothetical protein [Candidatus Limnocylindrales bacterium]
MREKHADFIGAAIDVGSNSIHVRVARVGRPAAVARSGLDVLLDRSELLGLGDVVDQGGVIPAAAVRQVLDVLAEYLALASANGAQQVTLIGTEPLRRATNAGVVAAGVRRATGLPLRVVSVRVEA